MLSFILFISLLQKRNSLPRPFSSQLAILSGLSRGECLHMFRAYNYKLKTQVFGAEESMSCPACPMVCAGFVFDVYFSLWSY